jgi:hypothetical protein
MPAWQTAISLRQTVITYLRMRYPSPVGNSSTFKIPVPPTLTVEVDFSLGKVASLLHHLVLGRLKS